MPANSGQTSAANTLGAVALVVLLLAGIAGFSRAFHASARGAVGRDAPDFALPVVANSGGLGAPGSPPATLRMKDLIGRPVLLDFWATWCGPCRAEAPVVDRVSRRWKQRGVVVVGVNTDLPDQGDPRAFAGAYGLSYPIVRDEDGLAQHAYAIDSLPTLVVVSRKGQITAVRTGITDESELEELLAQAD